jgi:UDP-galactopyranose mutase
MTKKRNIIIGSGPTGIGTAIGLGNDCLVLEAGQEAGGFSMSIEINGAVFDYGGHSFHTPHPEVKELVYNSLDMYEQQRDARCLFQGELIPYPFQKNYRQLSDPKVVEACRIGLEQTSDGKQAPHFEQFIEERFGSGIAEHFMLPYNRKLWGRDLKRLSTDWTSQRVAAPEGEKETFDQKGGQRKPLQGDTKVAYPVKGGFGEIWKALAKKIRYLELGKQVNVIDPIKRIAYTLDGGEYSYENLVSSMPITLLLQRIEGTPERLIRRATALDNLSLRLGLVVINHPVDTDIQRIYSAEEHIAAHKTAINHNSSDYLRRLPKHGIMMEISEGPEKALIRQDMERWILDNLLEMRLIRSESEVEKIAIHEAKYAYPVPTHDRNEIVEEIQHWLNEHQIYSIGRFGQWAYINSDEALYRGLVLGQSLAGK